MSSTCANCGQPLAPAAQFCAFCGSPRADAAASAATTAMPTASASPPPMSAPETPPPGLGGPTTGSAWAAGSPAPAYSSPPPVARHGHNPSEVLFSSLDPATVLVFAATALALGLPDFVYAVALRDGRIGSGAKTALALLLLLTIAAAAVGAVAAWKRLKAAAETSSAARLVFGFGVLAGVLALLELLAALSRG
ncbi:MAG: hypothetical protein QOJ92_657 [Frankiales bacterium]|nr:hypothetical protein [Frankiales bacterium]